MVSRPGEAEQAATTAQAQLFTASARRSMRLSTTSEPRSGVDQSRPIAAGRPAPGKQNLFKPLNVAGKAPTSVGFDQTPAAARSARRPSS